MSASQVNMDESSASDSADISDDLKQTFSRPVAEKDEASMLLVGLRDVAIISSLLSIFGAAEAWAQVSGLAFASLIATINGFLVGAATCAHRPRVGTLRGGAARRRARAAQAAVGFPAAIRL